MDKLRQTSTDIYSLVTNIYALLEKAKNEDDATITGYRDVAFGTTRTPKTGLLGFGGIF